MSLIDCIARRSKRKLYIIESDDEDVAPVDEKSERHNDGIHKNKDNDPTPTSPGFASGSSAPTAAANLTMPMTRQNKHREDDVVQRAIRRAKDGITASFSGQENDDRLEFLKDEREKLVAGKMTLSKTELEDKLVQNEQEVAFRMFMRDEYKYDSTREERRSFVVGKSVDRPDRIL